MGLEVQNDGEEDPLEELEEIERVRLDQRSYMRAIEHRASRDAELRRAVVHLVKRSPTKRFRDLLRRKPPHPVLWNVISAVAPGSEPGFNVWKGMLQFEVSSEVEEMSNDLLANLEQVDEALPAVTQDEALALLEKFLLVESGSLVPGAHLQPFHWTALAAVYCPRREYWRPLRELVRRGVLEELKPPVVSRTMYYEGSELRFPLTVTERGVHEIEAMRWRGRLPALYRVERMSQGILRAFPNLTKLLAGGLLWELLRRLVDYFV